MSFGNYKRKHYIALVDEIDELPFLSDLKRLANKITTITDDSDEQTESSVFYDSLNGAGDEILLGRTESWSVAGQYDPTDPAHRIIARMRRKDDEERLVWHLIEETNGTFIFGLAKILNPVAGGGEASDKEELSCRITFVKKPDVHDKMPGFPEKDVPEPPVLNDIKAQFPNYSQTHHFSWEYPEKKTPILFTLYRNNKKIYETLDKECTITDRHVSGQLNYCVTASDEVGESKCSNYQIYYLTSPKKPKLTATQNQKNVILHIESDFFKTFRIYRNGHMVEDDYQKNEYIDTNVSLNTQYEYMVTGMHDDTFNVDSDKVEIFLEKEMPFVYDLNYSLTENPYEINLSWKIDDPVDEFVVKLNDKIIEKTKEKELKNIKVESIKNNLTLAPVIGGKEGGSARITTFARPNPPKAEIKADEKKATITVTDTQDNVSYFYKYNDKETEIKNKKATLELSAGKHNVEVFAVVEKGRSKPTVLTAEILEDPVMVTEAGVIAKSKDSFTIQFVKTNAEKYKVGIKETGFSDTTTEDTYTFKDLEPDTTYTFYIISVIGDKESETFSSVTSTASEIGEIIGQGKWGTMDYVTYEDSEGYTTCVLESGETGTDGTPKVNHLIFNGDVEKFNTKYIGNDEIYKKITVNKILDEACNSLFRDSKNEEFDFTNINTSNVTRMDYMFSNSKAITLDVSNFDTSNVTNMDSMFSYTKETTLDVSNFDTSNVTSMNSMFSNSQATTLDVSNFDTSNVTSMNSMFNKSQVTTLDLSNFDTSNVTGMFNMFNNAKVTKIKFGEKFKFTSSTHRLPGRWIKEDDPDVVFTSESDWTNNYDGTKHAGWYVKDTAQTLEWYEDDPETEEQSDDTDEQNL